MKKIKFKTSLGLEVSIDLKDEGGLIETNICELLGEETSEIGFVGSYGPSDGASQVVESLILGHAISGVDVASAAYIKGLDTMLEAWGNHL